MSGSLRYSSMVFRIINFILQYFNMLNCFIINSAIQADMLKTLKLLPKPVACRIFLISSLVLLVTLNISSLPKLVV